MDIRETTARYYDQNSYFPDDIPFYLGLIPPDARVLELGCGTGRVTLPLAAHCSFIHGIDLSPAMIQIGCKRLQQAGIPPEKAHLELGDITNLNLGRRFDWVIAPFRVLQNLETDGQVDDERVVCSSLDAAMDKEKLVLYPKITYRRYRGDTLLDEAVLKIVMRCYYPHDFESLVQHHGFQIVNRWGGYLGESYGHGPELVR